MFTPKKIAPLLPTEHPRGGYRAQAPFLKYDAMPTYTLNMFESESFTFIHFRYIVSTGNWPSMFSCQTLITQTQPYYKAPFMEQ
jgi:hypothetical protein